MFEKHNIGDKIMRPWLHKKLPNYLGKSEDSMVTLILRLIAKKVQPTEIMKHI